MPLVSYDSSSESDSEPEPSTSKTTVEPAKSTAQGQSLTSTLIARKNLTNKKIEIVLPDFEDLESSSSDDEDNSNRHRIFKQSSSKSQLSALLPPAKSSFSRPVASSSTTPNPVKPAAPAFVPYTLTQKKKPPVKVVTHDDDDEESGGFFSFDDHVEPEVPVDPPVEKDLDVGANVNVNIAPESRQNNPVNTPVATASSSHELSEDQFKKLVARKFGDVVTDEIELVDVKVDEHLVQNREYIKTISVEKNEKLADDDTVNSTHKRKNHITHLAFQAKKRELDLKNQWAQNKLTKSQSRAKYGF